MYHANKWRGTGGREARGERAGSGILTVAGTGRKQVKFRNVSLYFAMEWNKQGRTAIERYGRREVQPPLSPPPTNNNYVKNLITTEIS